MSLEIQPFINAQYAAFEMMADERLEGGDLGKLRRANLTGAITAFINITGEEDAVLVLTLNPAAAKILTREIIGKEVGDGDSLITDSVCELLNMIVGSAQRNLHVKINYSSPLLANDVGNLESALNARPLFGQDSKMKSGNTVGLYITR